MMPTSHVAASQEPEHHQLTAANLKALEPNLTEQHEVLGRFVGGSNSLIARAELQALFRANGVLGDAGAQDHQLVAGYLQQQLPADLAGMVGAATSFGQSEYAMPHVGGLSSELDYPGPLPETHWHSQATTAESWGHNLMSPTADEALGDPSVGNSYGMPASPTKQKAYSDLGDSIGYQSRPRCGRASSEYQRASMVGQLPAIHPQLQAGMVGGYPLGTIGQIPEGSAAQMGAAGQFVRTAPQFSGPVSRMIGPFPAQVASSGSMMYSAPMQQPGADVSSHMVGQYPSIGALQGAYGTGTYPVTQTDDRLRRYSAPVGQAQQLQDARQLLAMRNSGNVGAAHLQAGTLPAIGATERRRPIIGEVPSYTQASSVAGSMAGDSLQGASQGMSQVEVLQQYYAAHAAQQQFQQQMASALLVPRQSQTTTYSSASDMYSAVPSNPSRGFSSAQGTAVETESQLPSDPSEAPVVHTGSLESKSNNNKVRVVCKANGVFIRQAGGHYEYEGGDTRLVSVSNWVSLTALKEAMERVIVKAPSRSVSGPPEAMYLKYQLPSDPTVYVDLLDDEDVQLMFDEWADYAEQNKGTSYKLHIYVAWSKDCDDKTTSLSDVEEPALSSGEVTPTPCNDEFGVVKMAGRMEIINANEISMAKFLGSGGYGEVYLGRWHSSEVAIKCLNPSLFFSGSDGSASKAAMADLLREADLLASLRHPNVVWVYGVVLPKVEPEDGRLLYDETDPIPMASGANLGRAGNLRPPAVVTEFMSQGSVKQALARKSDVVSGNMHRLVVAMDAAKGMEYLHQKSIVHFDLKSANLLLGYRDRRAVCKVSDFGLSKQKHDTYVSNVTSQRGTLPWIAPEIIKTPHAVTEKVDVYSFGVVLWELWTGKEPYEGLNYHALLHQITLTGGTLRPTLPNSPKWEGEPTPEPAPGWCNLVERCWQEAPEQRPSFAEIVRELKAMGQALRPPRNRPRSQTGASVSSAELDARGIPSGRPGMASPAKAMQPGLGPGMPRQGTMQQPMPAVEGHAPNQASARPPHPGGPGMVNSPSAGRLVNSPSASKLHVATAVPQTDGKKPEKVLSGGPSTPPEKPPTTEKISREHSEEPSQALANVAGKLGGMSVHDPRAPSQDPQVQQQLGAAIAAAANGEQGPKRGTPPPVNPFSSAFAYTERMNSAFTSEA